MVTAPPVLTAGRAAMYVRMSTEHQQYSTENQADAIGKYASRNNLLIVKKFVDYGESGLRLSSRRLTSTSTRGRIRNCRVQGHPSVRSASELEIVSLFPKWNDYPLSLAIYYMKVLGRTGERLHESVPSHACQSCIRHRHVDLAQHLRQGVVTLSYSSHAPGMHTNTAIFSAADDDHVPSAQ
jgi:hypothetical protein